MADSDGRLSGSHGSAVNSGGILCQEASRRRRRPQGYIYHHRTGRRIKSRRVIFACSLTSIPIRSRGMDPCVHFILRVPSYVVLYTADIGVGQAVGALVLTLVGVLITEVCLGIGPALRPYRSHDYVSLVQFFAVWLSRQVRQHYSYCLPLSCLASAAGSVRGGVLGAITADLFGTHPVTMLSAVLLLSLSVTGLLSPPAAGLWFEHATHVRPATRIHDESVRARR